MLNIQFSCLLVYVLGLKVEQLNRDPHQGEIDLVRYPILLTLADISKVKNVSAQQLHAQDTTAGRKASMDAATNPAGPATAEDPVRTMKLATQRDLETIWSWNQHVPEAAETCVHHLIADATRRQPNATAVSAWDGEWTYGELDGLSTRLACHLVRLGIARDVIVPLCFEKSKWTPVAMMAVAKAGGASLALDCSLPYERLRNIVSQVSPMVVLSSEINSPIARRLIDKAVLVVDEAGLASLPISEGYSLPYVHPSSSLYVCFTSGSSGQPKGVVITHENITSAIRHQREALHITPDSRTYDFSGPMFDVIYCNLFQTLSAGGCLCIPSDATRRNSPLSGINELSANTVIFTPSTVRGLDLTPLRTLRHLNFIGEAIFATDFEKTADDVEITNLYGPTECTTFATAQNVDRSGKITIGKGFGLNTWLVHPDDHSKLVAVGEIGELLLEGPLLSPGYLGDAQKTSAVFIESPEWLAQGSETCSGRHGSLYKTGDLAQYTPDGSLAFLGRKDAQVKINGQRVELSEIESHLRQNLSGERVQVVAEMIQPQSSTKPLLVAFLRPVVPLSKQQASLEDFTLQALSGLNEKLALQIPAYMIPAAYFPLQAFPTTATGKIDRRALRAFGASLKREQLMALNQESNENKRQPSSPMERRLQALWAIVLGVEDATSIGAEDSFLRIGGDSVGAMRLVGQARDQGLVLSVADVFNHPRLSDLATVVQEKGVVSDTVQPFALLRTESSSDQVRQQASKACNVAEPQIEDVFPCTPLQEGLLALSAKQSGDYLACYPFQLREDIDTTKFRSAWDKVVETTPILRTRIIDLPGQGLVQVVLRQNAQWSKHSTESLEAYMQDDRRQGTGLGEALVRYGLVEQESSRFFVWTVHHAAYDGWSMALVLRRLEKAYYLEASRKLDLSPPFQSFVRHIMDMPTDKTHQYWVSQFRGSEAQIFPELPSSTYQPRSNHTINHRVHDLHWPDSDVTPSTAVRVAWAIVTSRHTNSHDVIFGAAVTGRQATVQHIEQMTGPTIATVPVRVVFNGDENIEDLCRQVQAQSIEMTPFEQTGLQNIRRLGDHAQQACDFQTLLVVQPEDDDDSCSLFAAASDDLTGEDKGMVEFRTYALSLECWLGLSGLFVKIRFDSEVVSRRQAQRLGAQFEQVLRQVCGQSMRTLADISMQSIDTQDLHDIWSWNATLPASFDRCVHDMISEKCRQQPDQPAICAWDGEWTYSQVDLESTRLAHRLISNGVQANTMVPILFEKSKWTPIAMLAAMKAGAASVALDAALPEDRLRAIIQQLPHDVVLSSASNAQLAGRLCDQVIQVSSASALSEDELVHEPLPPVTPDQNIYIVFTSGSTGLPKGVAITHANIASAIYHQRAVLQIDASSRIYDNSSYLFDVVYCNLLQGLTAGACICIPSDFTRRNDPLAGIEALSANTAIFTPSAVRGLDFGKLTTLRQLHFIGEPVTTQDLVHLGDLRVTNLYGPTEATTFSTAQEIEPRSSQRISVGKGFGLNTWLVRSSDHNELVPVGEVGELLLEGPLLSSGYFGDAEKTAAAFIRDPLWLLQGAPEHGYAGRHARLYKTGDLARYEKDGTITFIGRKDSQVKLNGQRVELGEIEHAVTAALKAWRAQVVVQLVKSSDRSLLVAFIELGKQARNAGASLEDFCKHITSDLEAKLASQIPAYMIPSVYMPIDAIPMTASGKTDRRQLKQMGERLTKEDLATLTGQTGERRKAETPMELRLQSLWTSVIAVSPDEISAEDNFLRIGGDSISAMRLVGAARAQSLSLTVADIFKHPRLCDLAKVATQLNQSEEASIAPFTLMSEGIEHAKMQEEVAALCGVKSPQVEDVFPCTPLQAGLLALTAQRPGYYVARYAYVLNHDVDIVRLQQAWTTVLSVVPVLRTRIVDLASFGLAQAVIKQEPTWTHFSGNLAAYVQADRQIETGLSTNLARFGIVTRPDLSRQYFVWTIHHAIYDGWSMQLIMNMLERAYEGRELDLETPPFQKFVKHLMNADKHGADDYWREQFNGLAAPIFPQLPTPTFEPKSDVSILHKIEDLKWPNSGITPSTIVRAAWSLLIAEHTDACEVVLGITTTGRQAALPGVEDILGPTIATVPVRISVEKSQNIDDFLQRTQSQSVEMTTYEQTGLQQISKVSKEAEQACQFQTLLVIQPAPSSTQEQNSPFSNEPDEQCDIVNTNVADLDTHGLTVEIDLMDTGAQLRLGFDSTILPKVQVERLATQLEHVMRQICDPARAAASLSNISTTSPNDLETIWRWNADVLPTVDMCVHDKFAQVVARQPQSQAICAWDGSLTYLELDQLSTRLAQYLISLGVKEGMIVPVLFEKSKWTSTAVMAVMKAGAASVTLDVGLPTERLRMIVDQVKPPLLLSSASASHLASSISEQQSIVVDDAAFNASMAGPLEVPLPQVDSQSRLYIVFTSGSTGVPKGVQITHSNFSSAIEYQQSAHGFVSTSRVLDFASYAFDVSNSNMLHTFTIGACLCIPSEADRRDRLEQAMIEMDVTHADLTPSTAGVLSTEMFKRLTTLVLGGEALSARDAETWSQHVNVKNPYGPCECTPTATITDVTPDKSFTGSIGKGLGLHTWIVDANDSLAPIGSIGELLLEGPLVGPGYLNDPEKTAAAFIWNPGWLQRGPPNRPDLGRNGRLYRTGDLVSYDVDGSLKFVGRKDQQIKINGQRVELSEIEAAISQTQTVRQAACLLPKTGPFSGRLVGVISLSGSHNQQEDRNQSTIQPLGDGSNEFVAQHVEDIRSALDRTLPSYMNPSDWIILKQLPLNASGKLSRKDLLSWLCGPEAEQFAKTLKKEDDAATRESATDAERILREVCSRVLNIATSRINLLKSFIANGGDSISAMRLVPHCRAAGLSLSVASLLRCPSLVAVAEGASMVAAVMPSKQHEEQTDTYFDLSPIQKWFFAQSSAEAINDEDHHFNQGFYLKMERPVPVDRIKQAIDQIVQHHSMLRARFSHNDGVWRQKVIAMSETAYHFAASFAISISDLESLIVRRQRGMNLTKGPVFIAEHCKTSQGDEYLLLIAHHLVTDLVSWRIIFDDLENILSGAPVQTDILPFQTWTKMQADKAASPELDPEHVLSTIGAKNDLQFWQFDPSAVPNATRDRDSRSVQADERITALLLHEANRKYSTEPVDLILAAVYHAFFTVLPDRQGLTVFTEGHGREPWSTDTDLSRTVGWFTTISPMTLNKEMVSAAVSPKMAMLVKDARKCQPSNGWSYFASRFLNEQGIQAFESHDTVMEVAFNYHGMYQQLEAETALFRSVDFNNVSDEGPALPAPALFDINVSIAAGRTQFHMTFNRHIAHQEMIHQWVDHICPSLELICSQLALASTAPQRTLCDYELLQLNYSGLEELQATLQPQIEATNDSSIEDIVQCSPMVNGMLLSMLKSTKAYKTTQTYAINTLSGGLPIQLKALADAWQKVIAHQPSLRSVFIPSLESSSSAAYHQVILKSYVGQIIVIDSQSSADAALAEMDKQPEVQYQLNVPPHRLTVCQAKDDGTIFARIEMSHTITDGASTGLILRDWASALNSTLGSNDLLATSRAFARAIKVSNHDTKMAYWRRKLSTVEPCHFPRLSASSRPWGKAETATSSLQLDAGDASRVQAYCEQRSVTASSILQTAWALTLASYCANDSVCFGYLSSGRDLPIRHLEDSIGAYANMIVCRVTINRQQDSPAQLIEEVRTQVLQDMEYQHCSLAEIQHGLDLPAGQSLFNSVFSFQKYDESEEFIADGLRFKDVHGDDPTEFELTLNIRYSPQKIGIYLDHRLAYLSSESASEVLSLLKGTLLSLVDTSVATLSDLQTIGENDLSTVWRWNSVVPAVVDGCVHELFSAQAIRQPDAPAVCAWNGDWTYSQLDALSTRLAAYLMDLGVTAKAIVPILSEKSKWVPLSLLAIMKAGAATVLLESGLPEERLSTITSQVNATLILSSPAKGALARRVCSQSRLEVIDDSLLAQLEGRPTPNLPIVDSKQLAYVVFTSGSTGTPKGVQITHENFCSAIKHQQAGLGFKNTSRTFDFTSYAFDVAWSNHLHTLTSGACLCIPSDDDLRNNVAGSLKSFKATFADLTPSLAASLDPADFKDLQCVLFSGEALPADLAVRWAVYVRALNTYGPAECSVKATWEEVGLSTANEPGIGRGEGLTTWVTAWGNSEKLLPIGVTGELLLEGPLVGPGYIGDPEKTASSFIDSPLWLSRGTATQPGRRGKLYKTGDLVRYNTDGSLVFVGRFDNQTKINGQRVELGDIETHVRNALQIPGLQIIVETILPSGADKKLLVAFVAAGREAGDQAIEAYVQTITAKLEDRLTKEIPSYMIPFAYVPLADLPMTPTGKTDRRRLRAIGEGFTRQQLVALSGSRNHRSPTTEAELRLQALWSVILDLPAHEISAADSFLRIGGDSIGAMKLVAAAREQGISISVADVFRSPRLEDLAKIAGGRCDDDVSIEPFSLLPAGANIQEVCQKAAQLCNIGTADMEDIFPCTPLQEGLLALTMRRSGDYVARYTHQLQAHVDLERFRHAWDLVVSKNPILRTRIVDLGEYGLAQVVMKEDSAWVVTQGHDSLSVASESDGRFTTGLGLQLVRYGFSTDETGKRYFALTIHHALYDGWSMPITLQRLEQAYAGETLPVSLPFQSFVKHILQINSTDENNFWREQFQGMEAQVFPTLPSANYQPLSDQAVTHHVQGLRWPAATDVTAANIVRAAWSIVASQYTGSHDVLYGVTSSGRQVAIAGAEDINAPTIATVPVRALVDHEITISAFLQATQTQAMEMVDFEQTGLQNIRRIDDHADQACQFQTLLVIHPLNKEGTKDSSLFSFDDEDTTYNFAEFDTHALTLDIGLEAHGAEIGITFDSSILATAQAQRIACQLEFVLLQLCDDALQSRRIKDLDSVSRQDIHETWTWNRTVPPTNRSTVHDMISEVARRQTSAPAIAAWDGELTYGQLEDMSTRLASHLVRSNLVEPDTIVPLCFEKSKWTPVAMLSIMKAGAASVLLDPGLPEDRLRSIADQVRPTLMLSSGRSEELARRLSSSDRVFVLDEASAGKLRDQEISQASSALPFVSPDQRLYVVFTSGSTGQPKGVVIHHYNFASALEHQQAGYGFDRNSRVYDFAAYSFDVAWSNALWALQSGSCLCIPSDSDKRDNLAGSLVQFGVTHAELTPSAASILPISVIAGLSTLIVGGERLGAEQAKAWAQVTKLKNSYGPCECTPTATVFDVDVTSQASFNGSIGRGMGLVTWIADPMDTQSLVPIGSIGELLLEGPLVGAGYLDDSEKTAAAFISDPQWLVSGTPQHPGRRGRIYKTGDLARYNADGTISYIGRKDAQVKINGQRVELAEIEAQILLQCSSIRQVACFFPKTGAAANRLVALISLAEMWNHEETLDLRPLEGSEAIVVPQQVAAAQASLEGILPAYMIPSTWVALKRLPLNASGKLDRKQLNNWLLTVDRRLLSQNVGHDDAVRAPESESERILQSTTARTLNVAPTEINLNKSFIANGGDSISAMRLAPQCRVAGVVFSVSDLLRAKSLAEVASMSTSAVLATVDQDEQLETAFPLAPIQRWFFAQCPAESVNHDEHYSNQGFYVKLGRAINCEDMHNALTAVVHRHSMLRARFERETGTWMQRILPANAEVFQFISTELESIEEVEQLAAQRQRALNVELGPVFVADFCTLESGQYLVMVAHHLVVDLVSWRVILDDLETILTGGTLAPVGLPFQVWNRLQSEKAITLNPQQLLSTKGVCNNLDFWGFNSHTDNTVADHDKRHVTIDERTTTLLVGEIHNAYNTEVADVFLAAIWWAFFQAFPERDRLTIFSEGHGRESWDAAIDVSTTVGWFTTLSPINIFSKDVDTLTKAAILVKDARKRLPSNGWAYFTSKFLGPSVHLEDQNDETQLMEVVFNYHGQFQQLEQDDALFNSVSFDSVAEEGRELPAGALININMYIEAGETHVDFAWNRRLPHQRRIQSWIDKIRPTLMSLCDELANPTASRTLADYEFLDLDYIGLAELQRKTIPVIETTNQSEIAEILTCSPMVDGMLLSQIRDPSSYKTTQLYHVRHKQGSAVDATSVADAWQALIARQPSLRSLFIEGLDGTSAFNQVILRSHQGKIDTISCASLEDATNLLQRLPTMEYEQNRPPHRLVLCTVADGTVLCRLDMSHAITDGSSSSIILREWTKAIAGSLVQQDLIETSRGFARSLRASDPAKKMHYWKTKLDGVEHSHFPRLTRATAQASGNHTSTVDVQFDVDTTARIRKFCESHSITPASVFQTAWAVTLAAYTASDSACFGYLASGRDLPLVGLDDSIGAYANMLVCRASVPRTAKPRQMVVDMHNQVLQDFDHQHCSLAQIQHQLGTQSSQQIFNTILSYQNQADDPDLETGDDEGGQFTVDELDGDDPDEVSEVLSNRDRFTNKKKYPLSLSVVMATNRVDLYLKHQQSWLTEENASRVLSLLKHSTLHILDDDLVSFNKICASDTQRVWDWNAALRTPASLPAKLRQHVNEGVKFCSWVVDPSDHTSLLPIGVTGELLLEAAADEFQPGSASIDTPDWLERGAKLHSRSPARLRKTGDLVRYDEDGELIFVGKKDALVKVNGQRVQLEQIEACIMQDTNIPHGVVVAPQRNLAANQLIAVVSSVAVHDETIGLEPIVSSEAVTMSQHVKTLRKAMDETLPPHLVPTIWISVHVIPVGSSGEPDRHRIESWLSKLDADTLAKIQLEETASNSNPGTEAERILRDACARVLNVQADRVNLSRSFVANGGDSISAMRLIPQCRVAGISLSVASLLRSKTLTQAARTATASKFVATTQAEEVDQEFPLSPIQQWFFDSAPSSLVNTKDYYSNQGFYVQVCRKVTVQQMSSFLAQIVQQHSMLRARFKHTDHDDSWTQRVLPLTNDVYQYTSAQESTMEDMESLAAGLQRSMDIEKGPVFAASLCELPSGEQYLLMVAHHLVIDLVSWRILLDDLETLMHGGILEDALPFQAWNKLQIRHVTSSEDFAPSKVLSTTGATNDLDFWSAAQVSNTVEDHDSRSITVDSRTTSLLLGDANRAFGSEPVDILLATIYLSFFRTFHERRGLTIFNEGHGRESSWNPNIDLSRTVGWFTTMYPVQINRGDDTESSKIVMLLKDARKRLPSNGWAYFASRYLTEHGTEAFKSHGGTIEVEVNYHGQVFQQLEQDDPTFKTITLNPEVVADAGPALAASTLFSANIAIENGCTNFSFTWNRHIRHQDRIKEWLDELAPSMALICEELAAATTLPTLSDYELVYLDHAGLDRLTMDTLPFIENLNFSKVVEVLPCSPMVDGMLLSQLRDPEAYKTVQIYEIATRDGFFPDVARLVSAWQAVVARQPAFRSVFVEAVDSSSAFTQLILDNFKAEVLIFEAEDKNLALEAFETAPAVDYSQSRPPHRLSLCSLGSNGNVVCRLDSSHVITDGESTAIILNDWALAYEDKLTLGDDLIETNREFARLLNASSATQKLAHWSKKLRDVEPSLFPRLSTLDPGTKACSTTGNYLDRNLAIQLQQFCEIRSVTAAGLFQSAWALALASYTGANEVVFGYLTSGRDIAVPRLQESVGAWANMMVCRASVSESVTVFNLVDKTYEDVLQDLSHQHLSLADIQHEVGLSAGQVLFNTIMSFQNLSEDRNETVKPLLTFADVSGDDPTEVS